MRVLGRGHRVDGQRADARPASVRQLQDRLADARSGKVAFVSHCLLNQNVRYLGGATHPAAIDTVVDDLRCRRVGIVQMPCPEQAAWGGVLKRRMLPLYGSRLARSRVGRRLVVPAVRRWTAHRYRSLAREVARSIADYLDSGYVVTEVVGVGSSPSCGVTTTIDLARGIEVMARCDPTTINREAVNTTIVAANTTPGRGLFVDALLGCLAARHISVTFREHDLLAELGDTARRQRDGAVCLDQGRTRTGR